MSSETFNLIEGLVWILAGAGCLGYSVLRLEGRRGLLLKLAGADLLVFGLTDLYEMRTGAWWDPVWLGILKSLCIAAFIAIYVLYIKDKAK